MHAPAPSRPTPTPSMRREGLIVATSLFAACLAPDATTDAATGAATAGGEPPGTSGEASTGAVTGASSVPPTSTSTSTTGADPDATAAAASRAGEFTTTSGCACEPGSANGCVDGLLRVCAADCHRFVPTTCPPGQVCLDDACTAACEPGTAVCLSPGSFQQCNARGDGWEPAVDCLAPNECNAGACLSPCQLAEAAPSSLGCSFLAMRTTNNNNTPNDHLVVGNSSPLHAATVQFYVTPWKTNTEQAVGEPVVVPPGATHMFKMYTKQPFDLDAGPFQGGTHRVASDRPVSVYQFQTLSGKSATTDTSVLLPEHVLRYEHVIASWAPTFSGHSYFDVIAAKDGTTVSWTASAKMIGFAGHPMLEAGATDQALINRGDTLQGVAHLLGDLTGTLVSADQPIWVLGGASCTNVPVFPVGGCDHIQEQMLPFDHWGRTYVGAHAPVRLQESHYWRVFGGADGITVTTDPPQPGTPLVLDRGQWQELIVPNGTSFVFTGDGPFLPVQFLEGQQVGDVGDPSMYQMMAVEHFLPRYAFATGTDYARHYAQIIRPAGGAAVRVDGVVVTDYTPVGAYEVADVLISEGSHLAESDTPFGLISLGYATTAASYAFPGGFNLAALGEP